MRREGRWSHICCVTLWCITHTHTAWIVVRCWQYSQASMYCTLTPGKMCCWSISDQHQLIVCFWIGSEGGTETAICTVFNTLSTLFNTLSTLFNTLSTLQWVVQGMWSKILFAYCQAFKYCILAPGKTCHSV